MKLATLYKRAKTGKILYWQISTDGGWIHKESGQLGTDSPIQHRELAECKNIGKANEVSIEEQAVRQADSDWSRKKDDGYKELPEIGVTVSGDLMHWTHNYVNYKTLTEALNVALPQFNTDAQGNVKPMLATDWKKIKKINYPVLVQPKLDGVRCLMIISYGNGVTYLSRSGKEYKTLDHITKSIVNSGFVPGVVEGDYCILDGEIYSDELTFQEIIQAVKKQYPNSLKLHFRAYDVVHEDSQEDRVVAHLHDLVRAINSPYIHRVPTIWAESEEGVKIAHDEWVGQGYEGAMIRIPHGKYEQGTRSRTLLKVKEFNETEFEFHSWETGQREEDLIAVLFGENGTFRAKMRGNRAQKKEMRKMDPKRITVIHFGWTDDKYPRFPVGKAIRDYE